jgi:hypothetical protein
MLCYLSFSLLDKAALFERFGSDGIQRNNSCNCIVDSALGSDNLVCFLVDVKAARSPVYRRDRVSLTHLDQSEFKNRIIILKFRHNPDFLSNYLLLAHLLFLQIPEECFIMTGG